MSAIGFITLILRPDRVQILLRPGPTLRAPLSPQGRRARRLEGKVSFREGRTYSAVLNSRFQDHICETLTTTNKKKWREQEWDTW